MRRHPLKVDEGDRVRLFVMNAGPSLRSDFHVVGAIFDRVYPDGNPKNVLESVQTYLVPAGGGAVFETVLREGEERRGDVRLRDPRLRRRQQGSGRDDSGGEAEGERADGALSSAAG